MEFFTPFVLNYRGLGTGPVLTVLLSLVVLFSPSVVVPCKSLICLSSAYSRSIEESILNVLRVLDSSTPMSTMGNSD